MVEFVTMIHDVAFGGSGVGRLPDGKVVFVPYTISGEQVRARLVKQTKGFAEAELAEVLQPSQTRISPSCSYFGSCGGCQYQHMRYREQIRIKEKQLRDTLQRLGGFRELREIQVFSSPREYGYRNKITVHSGQDGQLGYYARDNRTILDIERCPIANDAVNARLSEFRLKKAHPSHISITDEEERSASPEGSFHQVHADVAQLLVSWVREQSQPVKHGTLVDLYCGSGFFTFGLVDLFQDAVGLDYNMASIHEATRRAQEEGRAHVRFFAAPVEERMEWILESSSASKRLILLDPPRQGVPKEAIEVLRSQLWERLIYVSCDPGTLARDLKLLRRGMEERFSLAAIGLFDMFPQTAHIEAAVVLNRT